MMFAERGDVDRCEETVELKGNITCHQVRCEVPVGYGNTVDRHCFSARGLETRRRENLAGPRVTTWQLIEVGKPR
jgi:hypothetical protein